MKHSAHLKIQFEDGTIALNTFEEDPINFTSGDNTLEPALESLLLESPVGIEQNITLGAGQIYPEHSDEMIHTISRTELPDHLNNDLDIGQIISFEMPTGEQIGGAIMSFDDQTVKVDFNHPLSGKILTLKYQLLS